MGSGETHVSAPFPGRGRAPAGPGGLGETSHPHLLPCPSPQHCGESVRLEHEHLRSSPMSMSICLRVPGPPPSNWGTSGRCLTSLSLSFPIHNMET